MRVTPAVSFRALGPGALLVGPPFLFTYLRQYDSPLLVVLMFL